jgi:hypothetical protein
MFRPYNTRLATYDILSHVVTSVDNYLDQITLVLPLRQSEIDLICEVYKAVEM